MYAIFRCLPPHVSQKDLDPRELVPSTVKQYHVLRRLTLSGRVDTFVVYNEGIVEAVFIDKCEDTIVSLHGLSGTDKGDGRSNKEDEHENSKRLHGVGIWKSAGIWKCAEIWSSQRETRKK